MTEFTGYLINEEERTLLARQCIDVPVSELVVQGDLPKTRGIKNLMRRDDQGRISSCSGFGLTNAAEVSYFLRSKKWRQFNPMWSYRRGQQVSNITGDRGATIHGVVSAAKRIGLLPEDMDGDGKVDVPYREQYNMPYPAKSEDVARLWRIGYSVELRGFDEILRFLQANQGAVVVGGPWGNWKPGAGGVCRRFAGGGGGHARCYCDWIEIDGETMLVEANSHGRSYGDNGFAYHTKAFVEAQAADRSVVTIGVSDLSSPEPRKIDWLNNSPWFGGAK